MARLASTVHVHESDGQVVIYGPGDEPTAAHAKLITNPKAWEGDAPAKDSGSGESDAEKAAAAEKKTAAEADAKAEAEAADAKAKADAEAKQAEAKGATEGSEPVKPPAVGTGSGTAPWAEYAKAIGLSLPDDATKASIMEAVTAHEAKA